MKLLASVLCVIAPGSSIPRRHQTMTETNIEDGRISEFEIRDLMVTRCIPLKINNR
jgi:hypothetical protein